MWSGWAYGIVFTLLEFPWRRFILFDAPVVMGVAELDVIENWFEELKRIAPARQ